MRVTVQRAAEMLGVSDRTVLRLIACRQIPAAAQFGRRWTIDEAALREWISTREGGMCEAISTDEGRRGGRESGCEALSTAAAYGQLMKRKRERQSSAGARS
jgi:excisionase family DNA binding protein